MDSDVLFPKYDETLEILNDAAKILELYSAEYRKSPISYSESLSLNTSYVSSPVNNEDICFQDNKDNDNGTYVVSSDCHSVLDEKIKEKLTFPYVESFVERIRLIKEKRLNNNYDAFWIDLDDSKMAPEIDTMKNISLDALVLPPSIEDNLMFFFFPRYLYPKKESLIIEEIVDEEIISNDSQVTSLQHKNKSNVDEMAEEIVNTLIHSAIEHYNETIFNKGDNNQQVCLSKQLSNSDSNVNIHSDTYYTGTTYDNTRIVTEETTPLDSIVNNQQISNDIIMPIEFKCLLQELREKKSRQLTTYKNVCYDNMSSISSTTNTLSPLKSVQIADIQVSNQGTQIKNKENNVFNQEYKEVSDGYGVIVGAEERFVATEGVGRSNSVSNHRDGTQPHTPTINIQSSNSVIADAHSVEFIYRVSPDVRASDNDLKSLVEIHVDDLFDCDIVGNENNNCCDCTSNVKKMKDYDEIELNKTENVSKDYVNVQNNVNSVVKFEMKSVINGFESSVNDHTCDNISSSNAVYNNNSNTTYDANVISEQNVEGENMSMCSDSSNINEDSCNNEVSATNENFMKQDISFKQVNGGEKLQIIYAPVRKLMSRSRKCIRAGNRRDARRRVASIRRSDVTPQPSIKKPPSCAGCLLLRVAPSGPFLLLDLSATESKSEKTFTNKLIPLGHICSCNQKLVKKSLENQDYNIKGNEKATNSLQVTNIGADESITNQESENLELNSSSNSYFDKTSPVSFISSQYKLSEQSELKNNLTESCENIRVLSNINSLTNKPSDKGESEVKDLCLKETNKLNQTCPASSNNNIVSSDITNNSNLEIKEDYFTPSDNRKYSKEFKEKSYDSVDYLTSRALNSYEVSSRLKRLEEKLRSSLESLKDSSIREIDNDINSLNVQNENTNFVDDSDTKLDVSELLTKTSESQQIEIYKESIKNNLEEFLKIHRDLKINEFCTFNNNDYENSCPTKNLLDNKRSDSQYINEPNHGKENSFEFSTDAESDIASDIESKELEEFERHERWASNEEYFSLNASIFASSSCQFSVNEVTNVEFNFEEPLKCYDELLDSSDSLSSEDEETIANTIANGNMRGDGPATDRRHNKDASNLKSLLKKATRKGKKNRVVFNENKNEFFEADYIILIREECQYDEENDEGVCTCSQHEMVRLSCCEGDCNGCEQDDCSQEGEPVTLSPPEGYKDSSMFHKDGTIKEQGLFNKDGTLREQGLFPGPGGLLVGESSGTVFSPQHLHQLQLIQRLQREQLRRAKAALGQEGAPPTADEGLEDAVEDDDPEEEITLLQPKTTYAKEIVAGEERPKVNSGQQTTPTDDELNEESRSEQIPTHQSSPMRLGGILKGGRLWKPSIDGNPQNEQVEDPSNFRDSASDEEGRVNRAVRFSEPMLSQCSSQLSSVDDQEAQENADNTTKPELTLFRIGSHLLSNNSLRPNSAVRQLFPSGPHFITTQRTDSDKQYLVTSESLRAFEEGKRSTLPTNYRDEDLSVRRTIDRNTLRRSLVKVEAKKKTPQKNDNSLSERIKMLTCNIDDDEGITDSTNETERCSPSSEETLTPVQLPTKCFSPSSSSSSASSCSSTSSTYKKLTDIFPKRQERIPECNEEGNGVVIIPQSDNILSNNTQSRQTNTQDAKEFTMSELINPHEQPAPDVLAGTPGAGDGDELARFVQQESARTERLRKKYNQQTSTENSDEDDQDDYGFSERPTVRGIKPHFGSTNEILEQMQTQMMPQQQTPRPGHISWPYYSESNLTMPAPHEHTIHHNIEQTNRPLEDYHQQATLRLRERIAMQQQGQRDMHNPRHHEQHHENIYQNCMTYVNVRCNGNERDMYGSQPQMASHIHTYSRQHKRPESPPPIRSYHQTMVLLPYANLPHQPHYSNTAAERNYHNLPGEQNNMNEYPTLSYPKQKDQMLHMKQGQQPINIPYQAGIPMQLKCSAPMAHIRTVQPRPLAQQMICFSERVKAPLYQAAPGSPVVATNVTGNVRGVPEGAPAPAASPTASQNQPHQHNSLYYAMNV